MSFYKDYFPRSNNFHTVAGTTARNSLKQLVKEFPLVVKDENILILGASGQVGSYLRPVFEHYYPNNIILTGVPADPANGIKELNVLDTDALKRAIKENNVKVIINLAALLSGAAEKNRELAEKLNAQMPIELIDIGKEFGVRRIFTPSSIAACTRDERTHAAVDDATQQPSGVYGQNKVRLEQAYLAASKQGGILAQSLRYAGVLTTKIPPSDGTTEELDRMIVAMAEYKVLKDLGRENECKYSKAGSYSPQIHMDQIFPMLDGVTVGYETFRFLHANPEQIKNRSSLYYLGEYSASLNDVFNQLKSKVEGFNIVHDEAVINPKKVAFGNEWPERIDNQTSINDWGFQARYDAEQSINSKFKKCITEFKKQYLGIELGVYNLIEK